MTLAVDALLARLRNHEDNLVERKPPRVNASEIRGTIVSFANSVRSGATGVLFVGVHDSGQILGVESPDELQKTVRHQCENVCFPPIVFSFSSVVLQVEGRDVLAIVIPESTNRPHFAGSAFVRRGSESVNASREVFDELIARRHSKVAAILDMRSQIVTVECVQHRLGSAANVADSRSHTTSECRVTECTPHYVRMFVLNTAEHVTEPLELVDIHYDEARHRPKLVIRGRGRS